MASPARVVKCPNDWNCQINFTYSNHVRELVPQVVQQLLAGDTPEPFIWRGGYSRRLDQDWIRTTSFCLANLGTTLFLARLNSGFCLWPGRPLVLQDGAVPLRAMLTTNHTSPSESAAVAAGSVTQWYELAACLTYHSAD